MLVKRYLAMARARTQARLKLGLLAAVVGATAIGGSALASTPQDELAAVRAATAQFHRVEAAVAAGYELGYVKGDGTRIITNCVANPMLGAMGYHYFNKRLIDDKTINVLTPEGLVYAPVDGGDGLKLVAVEYVVPGPASNPSGPANPPTVFGQNMHILVPAVGFHTLHAWIWSTNPSGMFAHWNPEVSCS